MSHTDAGTYERRAHEALLAARLATLPHIKAGLRAIAEIWLERAERARKIEVAKPHIEIREAMMN